LTVALVEQTVMKSPPEQRFDDRAIALSFGSARVLEQMLPDATIWPEIERLATPIREVHVCEHQRLGMTRFKAAELGVPALGYVAPAGRLIEVMARAAQASQSTLSVVSPARLERLRIHAGGVSAEVAVGPTGGATQRTIRATLLVAADGGQSTVRSMLGLAVQHLDYRQRALIANVSAAQAHHGRAFERFLRSGPVALLPLGTHDFGLIWSADTETVDELMSLYDEPFLRRLQSIFGPRLGTFVRAGRRSSFALHQAVSARQAFARVVLIGSAATHLHPVAGQGFNLALRDVATLSSLLRQACHTGEDLGSVRLLAAMRRQRQADREQTAKMTDGLVRLFSSDLLPLDMVRRGALLAVETLPGVKRALAKRSMGLVG
ncbi:MAG: 2-octaprenyl-6-methoxyphenol hydroxylase, partial [Gammaproteobacteria bacterium]